MSVYGGLYPRPLRQTLDRLSAFPTLSWDQDTFNRLPPHESNQNAYHVDVFDAFGNKIGHKAAGR